MCQMFAGQPEANYEYLSRSLRLNGQSTSVRLERRFWNTLDQIASAEELSTPQFISKLYSEVIELHGEAKNFTSLLRCACLIHLEKNSSEVTEKRAFLNSILQNPTVNGKKLCFSIASPFNLVLELADSPNWLRSLDDVRTCLVGQGRYLTI